MSTGADIPLPQDPPDNAKQPALVIAMDDEEFITDPLLIRANGSVLMGNPTDFERAG